MSEHVTFLLVAVPGNVLLAALCWWMIRRTGATLQTVVATTTAFFASGLALRLVFWRLDLDLENHALLLWTWLAVTALVVGFAAGAGSRRVPSGDLLLAVLVTVDVAGFYTGLTVPNLDISSPHLRALLVAPLALLIGSYFSASIGYLLFSGGRLDFKLGYESIIGRRFLLSKSSSVLSIVTTISLVGVALGVWLVIISLGVLSGFEGDLQDKIIGANAHILVQQAREMPFVVPREALERARGIAGVAAAAPYVQGEVAIASQSNYQGGIVFGIDPERTPAVLEVFDHMTTGSLEPLIGEMRPAPPRPEPEPDQEFAPPAPLPGIILGSEMAKALNVTVGDRVRVISPLLETMTPVGGAIPKSRGFRVEGLFSIEMYEFDARFAYASLVAARRFLELGEDDIHGLQVRTTDPERAATIGGAVVAALGALPGEPTLEARDWQRRNQTLFAALKLERVVAFVVLVFIILVASFSTVNTLTMSVIEKKREISILMTMGARQVGVMKVFLVQGMLVGAFGTVIGVIAAVLTAIALRHIGFGIPGDVYYITTLPVRVGVGDVVLVGLAALLIVWDFAVFPALRGSRLEPVEGLRDG